MEKIKQSTQLKNMIAPLRKPGINVVISTAGIVIAGAAIGIVVRRAAKNHYSMDLLCSDERIPSFERDFQNLGSAIAACIRAMAVDDQLNALKG